MPRFPKWLLASVAVVLGTNLAAIVTTNYTISAMGGVSEFARGVRELDMQMLHWGRPIMIAIGLGIAVVYVHPLVAWSTAPAGPAPRTARRRALGAPLFLAGLGFLAWFPTMAFGIGQTLWTYGRWSPELTSQHILSPLVSAFFAATTSYLLLDVLFRRMVLPKVFPDGRLDEERTLSLGVGGKLLVTLVAVAFLPLFTMLGIVRSAASRFEAGLPVSRVIPDLTAASVVTFAVYVSLGIGLVLVMGRTLAGRLRDVAVALRRVRGGELDVEIPVSSTDEIGVVERGLNEMVETLREKERILGEFGRVVEPAVRDRLLAGEVQLGGELRTATVLFVDLRGFTTLSEGVSPTEVVDTLNEFFTTITSWVRANGGFVDKFIGDALLVVFGLFDEEDRSGGAAVAVRCALGIPERLETFNERRRRERKPELRVTMGMHTGELLAGVIGAADRHEFTVVGDTVNVAARLQETCKSHDLELLVSAHTLEQARIGGETVDLPSVESISLRGREQPVQAFGR